MFKKTWAKKLIFRDFFLKRNWHFGEIWYQKWILWLISIPEMNSFILVLEIVENLQQSINVTVSGLTLPLKNKQINKQTNLDRSSQSSLLQ